MRTRELTRDREQHATQEIVVLRSHEQHDSSAGVESAEDAWVLGDVYDSRNGDGEEPNKNDGSE